MSSAQAAGSLQILANIVVPWRAFHLKVSLLGGLTAIIKNNMSAHSASRTERTAGVEGLPQCQMDQRVQERPQLRAAPPAGGGLACKSECGLPQDRESQKEYEKETDKILKNRRNLASVRTVSEQMSWWV